MKESLQKKVFIVYQRTKKLEINQNLLALRQNASKLKMIIALAKKLYKTFPRFYRLSKD